MSWKLKYCMDPFVDKLLQDRDNLQGPTCMIADWVHWWATDIAEKLSIPNCIFSPSSAALMQLSLHCTVNGYVEDEDEFQQVPGLPPFQRHNLLKGFRNDIEYREAFLTRMSKYARECVECC
ncbi:unnamed protein product [Calypogeia fissa]